MGRLGLALCVVGLVGSGCTSDPADKLIGWPPTEPVVAVRDVAVAPEVLDEPDVVVDTRPVEVAPPPVGPCRELVNIGCELWTPFADACREAQKNIPDDTHGPTRDLCQALVDRYKKDELPRIGNPCGRLAKAICKEGGDTSERCRSARARVPLLTKRHQWHACLGDLLWFEAKTFRR